MSLWRGIKIGSVAYNPASNCFVLYDEQGKAFAEVPHKDVFYNPNMTRILHGQHWNPGPPAPSHPAQAPGAGHYGACTISPGPAARLPYPTARDNASIPDAGIRAGEITGLRVWRVSGDQLFSTYMSMYEWHPGKPMTGDVSDWGVHAFKPEYYEDAHRYARELEFMLLGEHLVRAAMAGNEPSLGAPVMAIGTVDLWGTVIEHEYGYRAQYAAVASLERLMSYGGTDLDQLRARYGVGQATSHV